MYKVLSRICNAITVLIMIGIFAVIIALIGPRIAGYGTYAVLSGSMEPTFHVGSIVYVDKSVTADEIEVGDPITFIKNDQLMATHRVIGINPDTREFTTKGDANNTEDLNPVPFESLVGRAEHTIPYLGYIALYVKTPKGIMAGVGILILLVLLYLIPEIFKPEDPEEKEREQRAKEEKKNKKARVNKTGNE